MHSTLFSTFFSLFVLTTTFVHSAPTASLDSATLLNNALEAQKLNAQFQTADSTATGSCNNGDTTCIQGAIASCVNGQFDTSQGRCPPTQQCFALPSVNTDGTIITCTSEKNALSLIEAAGASGGITGSDSDGSSIDSASPSSTSSGTTLGTTTSMDPITTPTSTALYESAVTVTVTVQVLPSGTTTLPSVTQTLTPEQASNLLSSLLADGGSTTTATSDSLNEPSETLSSTVSATATDSDVPPTTTPNSNYPNDDEPSDVLSSTVFASDTNIPSSSPTPSPSATPIDIANATVSPTGLGSASGGYGGY